MFYKFEDMIQHSFKAQTKAIEKNGYGPQYSERELPIEYTPLNHQTLKTGDVFGPMAFHISESSHKHHVQYIAECVGCVSARDSDPLYAFEFWPLPRVMSQWRFGRLNEVISVRAERIVHLRPAAGEQLLGETTVRSVATKKGLCFGFFSSVTKTGSGHICMTAEDVLLLANGCDPAALKEAVMKATKNKTSVPVEDDASLIGSWTLHMRYTWPASKWKNNIHTDVYAQTLGYDRGLVEGPGVADVVHALISAKFGELQAFRLSWKYLAPLYESTAVALVTMPSPHADSRYYLVCELPAQLPAACRVLLEVELEAI